jgi:hypothetical protein
MSSSSAFPIMDARARKEAKGHFFVIPVAFLVHLGINLGTLSVWVPEVVDGFVVDRLVLRLLSRINRGFFHAMSLLFYEIFWKHRVYATIGFIPKGPMYSGRAGFPSKEFKRKYDAWDNLHVAVQYNKLKLQEKLDLMVQEANKNTLRFEQLLDSFNGLKAKVSAIETDFKDVGMQLTKLDACVDERIQKGFARAVSQALWARLLPDK